MLSSRLTQTCLRRLSRGLAASKRSMSSFLDEYDAIVAERAAIGGFGIPPPALNASQTSKAIEELKEGPNEKIQELLIHRVPPGVDDAAYVKATWLSALATGKETNQSISRARAVELLGTMQGGYNVATLVELLNDPDSEIADLAADQLCHTLLVFDAFYDVEAAAKAGSAAAQKVLESWAKIGRAHV